MGMAGVLVGVVAGTWLMGCGAKGPGGGGAPGQAEAAAVTVAYRCGAGEPMAATYRRGAEPSASGPGTRPRPGGSVMLQWGDGRTVDLQQTASADGARYAGTAGADSLVFWSRGNGARLEEPGEGARPCIRVAADPGGLTQVFADAARGFSLRYPAGYSVDTAYRYQALGPGHEISGVAFTVPASAARGTNLSADSRLSVETLDQGDCRAGRFLAPGTQDSAVTAGGTTWSVARTTDAGAGNRYEETVYAIPGSRPCRAVRYFLHWTVVENYPPGTVREFDRAAVLDRMDAIRATLVIAG